MAKEVACLNQQKIIWNYRNTVMLVLALFIFAALFFFFRWLYAPEYDMGAAAVEAFNADIEKRLQMEAYADNFCIQVLSSTIVPAKVSHESRYGYPMPGLLASVFSRMTDGLHTSFDNPVTFFNFVYTAFSQYNSSYFAAAGGSTPGIDLPSITSFEDAPEGAIYFNEADEYTETSGSGQATPDEPVPAANPPSRPTVDENVGEPGRIAIDSKAPQVLIYHTHATESYMPNTALNYHTLNENYSVVSVGTKLAKYLQDKYKYRVIHDKTYHDKDSYAYSYSNSLLTIKRNVTRYKSLKVILDVHRDAFAVSGSANNQAKKNEYTAVINGRKAARIMLVVGKGNPNYKELEKFAVYIKKKMDKLYPGLFLRIEEKEKSKYNQYFSNHSMLIEVGCMLNTNEEAQYSGELLGKVIGEVLKDLEAR